MQESPLTFLFVLFKHQKECVCVLKTSNLIAFMVLLIALPFHLHSQEAPTLFETKQDFGLESLSETALTKFQRLQSNEAYSAVIPITLKDFATTQKNGTVAIKIPNWDIDGQYSIRSIEAQPNGDFDWGGQDKEDPGNWAIFSRRDGALFGYFTYEGIGARIISIEPGFPVLIISNNQLKEPKLCGLSEEKTSPANNHPEKSDCGAIREIRVLFLYTQAADGISNPQQESVAMINQINTTLTNSNVNDVVFERAGAAQVIDFVETLPTEVDPEIIDLDRLKGQLNNPSTLIAKMRNDRNADLVVLMTDGNYPGTAGISGFVPIQADNAYCIVEVDANVNSAIFVHEIGHNLGCRHEGNMSTDPLISSYANAYLFTTPQGAQRKTIVASGLAPGLRILNFSNPQISVENTVTGTFSGNNNARQIDLNTADEVACYEMGDIQVTVYITGFNRLGEGESTTWCTTTGSCEGPSTFAWEYSYDGFNFMPFFGTNCASRTAPNNQTQMILRVTVTCADGGQDTDSHFVQIVPTGGGGPIPLAPTNETSKVASESGTEHFLLYPNPSSGTTDINFFAKSKQDYLTVLVRDTKGDVILNKTVRDIEEGNNTVPLDIDAAPGLYYVSIQNGNTLLTKKIIIK